MTATISNRVESVFGDKRVVRFDIALGVYAVGGVSLTPAMVGMQAFDLVLVAPSGGYEYTYNTSTSKIMAIRQPAITSTGVVTAPITVSMGNITITGPAAATSALLQLSNDSATAILTHASGSTVDALRAGFGIPIPTAVIAPVFTGGGTTQAVCVDATGTPTLSTTTRVFAIGK